jgi:hypothetical protein
MYSALPEDAKPYDDLADEISLLPRPNRNLDYKIHVLLVDDISGNIPQYTSELSAAVALIPHGWWWHLSHLEASVYPNRAEPGLPLSNAIDYNLNDRPISYSYSLRDDRDALPSALCIAMLLAKWALKTKAASIKNERTYLIQTGSGPRLVDKKGLVKEIPHGAWINSNGILIAHKDVFPQYDFQEPEDNIEED